MDEVFFKIMSQVPGNRMARSWPAQELRPEGVVIAADGVRWLVPWDKVSHVVLAPAAAEKNDEQDKADRPESDSSGTSGPGTEGSRPRRGRPANRR